MRTDGYFMLNTTVLEYLLKQKKAKYTSLYLAIARDQSDDGKLLTTYETLGRELGKKRDPKRFARAGIAQLESLGILTVKSKAGRGGGLEISLVEQYRPDAKPGLNIVKDPPRNSNDQ